MFSGDRLNSGVRPVDSMLRSRQKLNKGGNMERSLEDKKRRIESITIQDMLSLALVNVPKIEIIHAWTRPMKKVAFDWAAATHLNASGNEDIIIPPRPEFLKNYE